MIDSIILKIYIVVLFSIAVLFSCPLVAQDINKLCSDRELLLQEIESTRKLLDTKRTSREETFEQINLLTHEIEMREELIDNLKKEIEVLNLQIEQNQLNINELESKINNIKDEYVQLLQDTYLRRNSMNELLFFLSASDFSEAYHRHRLLKEYSSYRQRQGRMLIESQNELKLLLQKIKNQRESKELNLNKLENEYTSLNISKSQKRKLIDDLQKEEQWLKQQLAGQQRQAKILEDQILEYIRQSQSEKSTYGKDFKESMGKLIWPVSGGIVINYFGEHEHPVLKSVIIKNNGIDIQSAISDEVVVVYSGEISRVISIPGYNNAIIIRHGDYLTVYANLRDIYVKQGQKVETGEKLGVLYKEKEEIYGVLHFEIWEENQKLNPIKWLKP